MKYFTEDWCFGKLSNHEIEYQLAKYRKYIDNIYKTLPFVLKILAKNLNLHDGILINVCSNFHKNLLVINGVFGDLSIGYYFLEITYLEVFNLDTLLFKSIFEEKNIELLSDEIEMLSNNLFSHRMIFSTKMTVDITFKNLEIKIKNALPQDYKKTICKFFTIPI